MSYHGKGSNTVTALGIGSQMSALLRPMLMETAERGRTLPWCLVTQGEKGAGMESRVGVGGQARSWGACPTSQKRSAGVGLLPNPPCPGSQVKLPLPL